MSVLDTKPKLKPNLQCYKGAVLLNKWEVATIEWSMYVRKNWDRLTENLKDATILLLAGRHSLKSGRIGPKDDRVIVWHQEMVAKIEELKREDMAKRSIKLVFVDVNEFYDEKDELNTELLKIRVKIINPSLVRISICFSETLDLRFALELNGIFPELRLKRDLQLVTKGKQIRLDPTQINLLYKMADPCNIEKTTILHGPEGSGKTLLAVEVLKMKLMHYMKKMKLSAKETKDKIRVIVCGSYKGEDRVPLLLKQLIEETKDIEDFCTIEFKPLAELKMKNPDSFQKELNQVLRLENEQFVQSLVMMDELYPGFATKRWKEFKGLPNTDFVFALRHAFNDGACLTWLQSWFQKERDYQETMELQGVYPIENTVFCHLRKSYRCTQELLNLTYYMLIHSPPKEQLYKQKSFIHLPHSNSGHKPLWLEVSSLEAFINYIDTHESLKDVTDVMVIYEPDNIKDVIQKLRAHCLRRKWKICPSTSVMGSEASIVIIFDMKAVNFEAISRAVLQLIFVTTKKSRTSLTTILTNIVSKEHDKDVCNINCKENGKFFNQKPHHCTYFKGAPSFDNLLEKQIIDEKDLPDTETKSISPKIAEYCLLLIQVEDLKDEVKARVRNKRDLLTQQEEIEKLGWLIYEECALNEDITDFEPYFEQFKECNLGQCVLLEGKDVDKMMDLCKRGNLKLLAPLIQRSKDKNPGDKDKYTILHCATEHGHLNIVQYLLPLLKNKLPKTGLRTLSNGFTVRSETPLHLATRNGHLSIIEFMVPHLNGDINPARGDGSTVLHLAAGLGHLNIVAFYASRLDNPNPQMISISNENFRGWTPLHYAALIGCLEVAKHLCNLLEDKNPIANDGLTPLHVAALYGHLSIIECLVPHLDGDINPAKDNAFTVLHVAALQGHLNVVAFYTSKLDNPNPILLSTDKFRGRTPLHYAAQRGHLEVVKHLCNCLKNKNPSDDNGVTPLHSASDSGHIEIVKHLVQFLDNKHPKSGRMWDYRTPLEFAWQEGHKEVTNFLKHL